MKRIKAGLALLMSAATVLLTACGSLPVEFPGIEESSEQIDMGDRFQINFFFQNTENTYYISPNGDANKFFGALSQTFSAMSYSEVSKTYILDYDDEQQKYGIVEYDRNAFDNLIWEDARSDYSWSGNLKDADDNFYVLEQNHKIPMESRVEGGMLHLFLDEIKKQDIVETETVEDSDSEETDTAESAESAEEKTSAAETEIDKTDTPDQDSFFNPDAINVMFTDLSEKDITYLGEDLRQYYIADNRYSACILAIKLEMESTPKDNGENEPSHVLYYASKDNGNELTKNDVGDSRWFYLLMTGPTTDLATFAQNLTNHMEKDANLHQGSEDGGYEISDLYFTPENFNADEDLSIIQLDQNNSKLTTLQAESGNDALFESSMVRLEPVADVDSVFPVGIYRDEILEYRYTRLEKEFGIKGYQDANTNDFALNIYLEKEVESRNMVADTTTLKYVFGDPVIYYQDGDEWIEMDPDHQERFFHLISIGNRKEDGKHLTIIEDNSDECGIHDLYITVPILQRAMVNNVVSSTSKSTEWVLNECTFNSSDTKEEVKRTYYFDKFYGNLFGLEIEDSRDENNNVIEPYKDMYSQIDELKILIEDVH